MLDDTQTPHTAASRLAWQKTLFAPKLNSFEILRLRAETPDGAAPLQVCRNHAFETGATALPAFLAFAGLALRPELGDYDDSLSFAAASNEAAAAAAHLIWLDFDRYAQLGELELVDWLVGRLDALRRRSDAPIIVANAPGAGPREAAINRGLKAWSTTSAGTAILPIDAIAREAAGAFLDASRAALTGTRYGVAAQLEAARSLAFDLLPRFLGAPVKALAVDLDNTLYNGVLGEEGPAALGLTPSHAKLQAWLAEWAGSGGLVSAVSRNIPADVEALFAERADFPLRPEHVAHWGVGWGDKSQAVLDAAQAFRIAPDAVLFMDDNLGELIEASRAAPGLRLIYAGVGPEETLRVLERYPGLRAHGAAFAGRAADLKVASTRAALATQAVDLDAYMSELGATLSFRLDPREDRARLAELSMKTNQFNLALKRFSEVEVDRYLKAKDRCVVHVRLADRLSDSGSVASLFVRRDADDVVVDELCISCRALGRKLEDLIVAEALRQAIARLGGRGVAFDFAKGPRNAPARDWLSAFAGRPLPSDAGRLRLEQSPAPPDLPVTLVWTD
jgi:FkbH-like protein